MALIKCPDCGKMFSEYADKCPECGCPIKEAKKMEEAKKMDEFLSEPKKSNSYYGFVVFLAIAFAVFGFLLAGLLKMKGG